MADEMDEGMDVSEAPRNDLLTVLLVIAFAFICGGIFYVWKELSESYNWPS